MTAKITEKIFDVHRMLVGDAPLYTPGREVVPRRVYCSCGEDFDEKWTYTEHLVVETQKLVEEDIARQIELHRDQVTNGGSNNTAVMIRMALDVATRIARRVES